MTALDERLRAVILLFAGAGGTCTGLRWAGWTGRAVGVEWDAAACATARAAGHERVQGDVAELDPHQVAAGGAVIGVIGTPLCPSFSTAGQGAGRRLLEILVAAIRDAARGRFDRRSVVRECTRQLFRIRTDAKPDESRRDRLDWARRYAAMSALVVEPMRWIVALYPRWVMLEQVPPVLPLWQAMAAELRRRGYNAWCGVLDAEMYGVPQTRRRAILIADMDGPVGAPDPTHQRYVAGRDVQTEPDLFGDPLPPPVSMAEALGWDRGDVVGFPRVDDGRPGAEPVTLDGVDYRARDLRDAERPAQGVTEKTRSWERWPSLRVNDSANATERPCDAPAPTVFCSRPGNLQWRMWPAGLTGSYGYSRSCDEPAPTIKGGGSGGQYIAPERVVRTGNNSHVTSRDGSRAGDGGVQPYERSVDAPAPTLDTNVGAKWRLYERTQGGYQQVDGGRPARTVRPVNPSGAESAPRFGDLVYLDSDAEFVPSEQVRSERWAPGINDHPASGWRVRTSFGEPAADPRNGSHEIDPHERPAHTVTGKARDWTVERPSTTVQGDARVWPPGHKVNAGDRARLGGDQAAERYGDRAGTEAVRVTVEEAGVLQSFPPEYPWQGTRTAQYRQVGDAVPPLLAMHVLRPRLVGATS